MFPWKTKYRNGENNFSEEKQRDKETVFFLRNKKQFFYEFHPPKSFISSSKLNHCLHISISNGGMPRTYLFSLRIVLKLVFSLSKTSYWPSCRRLLAIL